MTNYAGKFETVDELENAYLSLQEKLGEQGEELGKTRTQQKMDPETMNKIIDDRIKETLFGGRDLGVDAAGNPRNLWNEIIDQRTGLNSIYIATKHKIPDVFDEKFQDSMKTAIEQARARGTTLSLEDAALEVKKTWKAPEVVAQEAAKEETAIQETKEAETTTPAQPGGTVISDGEKTPEETIKESIVGAPVDDGGLQLE